MYADLSPNGEIQESEFCFFFRRHLRLNKHSFESYAKEIGESQSLVTLLASGNALPSQKILDDMELDVVENRYYINRKRY